MMLRPLPPECNGLDAKSRSASESRSRLPGAALEQGVDREHDPAPRSVVWGGRDLEWPPLQFCVG